ncbi:MAG: recombinase family protein [Desulfobacteraceae bacterium]|nr:recombinase family protein [Desulfobacteraceae bacterium]
MNAHVGYIRVSSVGQNTERQLDGIKHLDKTFIEKASGKDTERLILKECLEYLREGDTLHVHSMDRLARNLMDLQRMVDDLTRKEIKVHFHKENLIFTSKADSMSKLMLQIMGAVAEFERSLIKERQLEGIAKAKQAGKHLGRMPALNDKQVSEAQQMVNEHVPKTEVAKHFNISRQALYRNLARKVKS